MNFELFVAKRITLQSKRSFSKLVVRLAIAAIALSLSVMLIAISVVKGFQGEIKEKITGFGSHIQIAKFNLNRSFENNPIHLTQKKQDSIRSLSRVDHIQAFANKPGILKADNVIEGVVLKGIGKNFKWEYFEDKIKKGDTIEWSDSSVSNEIVISKSLADKMVLDTGEDVVVYFVQKPTRARKFTISGIYNTGIEDIDEVFILSDIRHIQKLNNWQDKQTGGYEVFADGLKNLPPLVNTLNAIIPAELKAESIKQIFPQIFDWLGLLNFNVEIILLLMGLVASINMVTALLIMILERTQLIGILKAMGAGNGSVMRIFIFNAAFLIAIGIIVGNILGLSLLWLQDSFNLIQLSETSYYLRTVPVYFKWGLFLLVNIGSFVFCTLVMVLPAILIYTITPVKALRFE